MRSVFCRVEKILYKVIPNNRLRRAKIGTFLSELSDSPGFNPRLDSPTKPLRMSKALRSG